MFLKIKIYNSILYIDKNDKLLFLVGHMLFAMMASKIGVYDSGEDVVLNICLNDNM